MFNASLAWARLIVVALALACQISAGAAFPMRDAAQAQTRLVSSVAVFCQSGAHRHDRAPLHRQVPDHGLFAHGQSAAVLQDGAHLPEVLVGRTGGATLPGARAPPARLVAASYPRGPPNLV